MEDSNFLAEQANSLKIAAESLLEESSLLLRLAPLGKIEIIGSLRLGLMYHDEAYTHLVMSSLARFEAAFARNPAKAKTVLEIK